MSTKNEYVKDMVPTCGAMEKQEKMRRDDLWEVLKISLALKREYKIPVGPLYCMACGIVCFNMYTPAQPFSMNTRNPKKQGYLTLSWNLENCKPNLKKKNCCLYFIIVI